MKKKKNKTKNDYRNHKQYTRYKLYSSFYFIVNETKSIYTLKTRQRTENESKYIIMYCNEDYELQKKINKRRYHKSKMTTFST